MSHKCTYCTKRFRKFRHRNQHENTVHAAAIKRDDTIRRNRHESAIKLQILGEMGMPAEALAMPLMLGRLLR